MGKVGEIVEFYCVKCKKKVKAKIIKVEPTKKGTLLNRGKCPVCGTNLCIISKKDVK